MSERRKYSDNDKANALATLAANGGDPEATARQLDIPPANIRAWAKGRGVHPEAAQLCEEKRRDLADLLEELAYQLVDAAPQKIATAGLSQVVMSLAVAVDKMRLLRNEPTAINEQRDLTDAERSAGVAALLDRARARRAGQATPGDSPSVN